MNCVENSGSLDTGNVYSVIGLTPAATYTFLVQACTSAGELLNFVALSFVSLDKPGSDCKVAVSALVSSYCVMKWRVRTCVIECGVHVPSIHGTSLPPSPAFLPPPSLFVLQARDQLLISR